VQESTFLNQVQLTKTHIHVIHVARVRTQELLHFRRALAYYMYTVLDNLVYNIGFFIVVSAMCIGLAVLSLSPLGGALCALCTPPEIPHATVHNMWSRVDEIHAHM
jgi:hypothetical protein